jgi:hypothetical protein
MTLAWLLLAGSVPRAHDLEMGRAATEMAEAASRLVAALTPEQKAMAVLEFGDENRYNWHFVPRQRRGISFKDLTPSQLPLVYGLLATGLSQQGFLKATAIISLEQVLRELEKGKGPVRDPERYYLSVFGRPGAEEGWGWRFEGHHLSLNFTLAGGRVLSVTPSFFGANPAWVRSGPREGLRVLGEEEDLARHLVSSFESEQKRKGILSATAPSDIITGADRWARRLSPTGIAAGELTREQSERLWQLIERYVRRYRPEVAERDLAAIREAGVDQISFAWAGSIEPGQGHYYRIQGPTFVMEYDNTQDGANHAHTVWRDLENDFGEDLLRQHYEQHHH